MIIGLTGKARCGKDTAAKYLSKKYGFKHYDFFADVIAAEVEKRGMKVTKMNASKVGDEMRKKGGMGVMARKIIKKIDVQNAVITGFRSPQEVEIIRSKTTDFMLILVDAKPDVRFARRSGQDPKTEKAFFRRDEMDAKGKNMEAVFLMADEVVDNNGTIDELHKGIEGVLESILEG